MTRTENLDKVIEWLLSDAHRLMQIPSDLEGKQRLMRVLMNIREPRPVSEEFLRWQDAELALQREEKGVVSIKDKGLVLWQGDITRLKVDAIVNAANAQMLGCFAPLHACIDNCIHSAAGLQLREECNSIMHSEEHKQGRLPPTGDAVITNGYNLHARYVIHTVGPICDTSTLPGRSVLPTAEHRRQLADCYRNCLCRAEEKQLQSIAFCCISTGVFHFPNQLAAEIAVRTVKDYLAQHPETSIKTVVFNVFLDKDYDIYQRLLY